jgi:hypothetical protein
MRSVALSLFIAVLSNDFHFETLVTLSNSHIELASSSSSFNSSTRIGGFQLSDSILDLISNMAQSIPAKATGLKVPTGFVPPHLRRLNGCVENEQTAVGGIFKQATRETTEEGVIDSMDETSADTELKAIPPHLLAKSRAFEKTRPRPLQHLNDFVLKEDLVHLNG